MYGHNATCIRILVGIIRTIGKRGLNIRGEPKTILSVSQLSNQIKDTLEANFPSVWVSGEVSNLARPHSGHIYLTLKDETAQIRGAVWRSVASRLRFDLQDGLEVICNGEIDVYPPRGSYQLIIRQIQPKGIGALQLAFRQLHDKLAAEGLFDPSFKKLLPKFPKRIAFVTSPTGAAIRDFLEVLRRRWESVEVVVIPARVQGDGAAEEIAHGVKLANQFATPPDILVVGRGGGSLEDLWCFNEEVVVRAIFDSKIPVVSAVGHEIDVTLSDLVADVRALTPTEAAERILPARDEIVANLQTVAKRLNAALRGRASEARSKLDMLSQRRVLRRPYEVVHGLTQQLEDFESRAARAMTNQLNRCQDRVASRSSQLEALSPFAVLSRGYSLTERTSDGQLISDAAELKEGDQVTSHLARGTVVSRVEKTVDK